MANGLSGNHTQRGRLELETASLSIRMYEMLEGMLWRIFSDRCRSGKSYGLSQKGTLSGLRPVSLLVLSVSFGVFFRIIGVS